MLKLWLLKVLPFTARWSEAAPAACCGMCGACVTATVTGLTLEVVGARSDDRGNAPNASEDAGELEEAREVGVQPDAIRSANA